MNKTKILITLFAIFMQQETLAVLGDFPGQLPQNDLANEALSSRYRIFKNTYNNAPANFEDHYTQFENSINRPIDHTYVPNNYLARIRGIRDYLEAESNNGPDRPYLFSLVEDNALKLIRHRIDLARLDVNLANILGMRGNIVNTDINNLFSRSLRVITGRIFQVSLEDGLVNVNNSEVQSTSSGTLIDYHFVNHQINNLQANQQTNLNGLLTCAHAFGADDDRSAFFFVQTSNLDGDTGFPVGINDVNGNNELIDFLNANNASYRIDSIQMQNRQNNTFQDINLTLAQPQYEEREDMVVGQLGLRLGQQLPIYNINCGVQFQQNNVIANQRTFTAGYPGCDHLNTVGLANVLQEEGLSPFWSSGSDAANLASNNDGTLTHAIPTAKGMSGGPIFQLNNILNNYSLNVLGVITGGEDNNERGCHWR